MRQPAVATANVGSTAKSSGPRRNLQPKRPSSFGGPATPWGIELAGAWGRHTWGDSGQFWYYHPTQVTMRSVGPGKVPVPPSFTVSVDPQLVRDIRVVSVRLNNKPYRGDVRVLATTRTRSVYQTRWQLPVLMGPTDVLDVRLQVSSLTPPGALTTIKHAVVELTPTGTQVAQRRTGKESLTRIDSVWSDAGTVDIFSSVRTV